MDSYTITITPDDDSGSRTTLTVDTSTGQARVTSVHLHAPTGLTGGQMPSVDVGLLLQAVAGPSHAAPAVTAAPSAPEPADTAAATAHMAADTTAPEPVQAPATPRRAPAARTATSRSGRQKAAPAKAARKMAATAGTPGTERVYRRMPDDLAAVYRQAGTASAVASHYGVPRHTAHGWITRLKKQDPATTD